MAKRNGKLAATMAALYALAATMGTAYAKAEVERRQKKGNGGHSHRTNGQVGAFGGKRRAGIKLTRKMARNAYATRRKAVA